jgi:hypothetical protein
MEAVAAGDADPLVEAHLASCDACRSYVGRLEDAAASFRKTDHRGKLLLAKLGAAETPVVSPLLRTTVSGTKRNAGATAWSRALYVGAPLLAAAAALVLWARSPTLREVGPPATTQSVRLKGVVGLAVIRERAGAQERFAGEVTVRAGDRLRVEIDLDRPLPIAGGVLGSDGAWISLFSQMNLEPGAHYSDQAVHFDDQPTDGWVVVGDPVAVDRARTTRFFDGVTSLRVRVESE